MHTTRIKINSNCENLTGKIYYDGTYFYANFNRDGKNSRK